MFLKLNDTTVLNITNVKKVEKAVQPGGSFKLRITQADGTVVDHPDTTGAIFEALVAKIA